jgi:alpha-D-ribose 1-methylphosphonate 5-triphosphate synthase subunit PhnH
MAHPIYTPEEAQHQQVFQALLQALSYPGRPQALPGMGREGRGAYGERSLPATLHAQQSGEPAEAGYIPPVIDVLTAIGATLIDLETTFYTADQTLAAALLYSGARPAAPDAAAYQFFPTLHEADLERIAAAPIGTYTYPDTGATLVIGCQFGGNTLLRLSGPGVPGAQELRIGGVPEAFWELRRTQLRYPLGWDVFLVAGQSVVGLPRSCSVEVR